jgi:hypothetical protein
MRIADHNMHDIFFAQRKAEILNALREPTTSPELARRVGLNTQHISHRLRRMEKEGSVSIVGRKGNALVWEKV